MTTRRESFSVELLDINNQPVGYEVDPGDGASITVQSGQPIGRTLTGVVLRGNDLAGFDIYRHRLRVWMTRDGVTDPLGIFIPTTPVYHRSDEGDALDIQLHDQGYLLTQTLRVAYGAVKGQLVIDAIRGLAILAGVPSPEIADIPAVLGNYLAWPPGTPIDSAMATLCVVGGLTTPWFTAAGQMRVDPLPYVGADEPAKTWHVGTASEIAGPATESYDQWNRATEWLVISKADVGNFAGRYRLPDSHPRSEANGALPLCRVVDLPGLASPAECRDRARDVAQRDPRVHRTISLGVRTDPTLEQNTVATYGDADYLLTDFTIPIKVGADTSLTLRESLVAGEGT